MNTIFSVNVLIEVLYYICNLNLNVIDVTNMLINLIEINFT